MTRWKLPSKKIEHPTTRVNEPIHSGMRSILYVSFGVKDALMSSNVKNKLISLVEVSLFALPSVWVL